MMMISFSGHAAKIVGEWPMITCDIYSRMTVHREVYQKDLDEEFPRPRLLQATFDPATYKWHKAERAAGRPGLAYATADS